MKRSLFIRMIALAASVALLAGALVAAAVAGSPYETLKKAVLNVGSLSSHSFDASIIATLDGTKMETEDQYYEFVEGEYSLSRNAGYICYQTKAGSLSLYGDNQGSFYTDGSNNYVRNPFSSFSFSDEDPRYVRLFEMAIDLLVGDLKNNISMTQTGDVSHVSGTLTANQIPELYNAAFDLLMAESGGSYYSVANEFDMSTFDPVNLTIEQTCTYIRGATLYEEVSEYTLQPVDIDTYFSEPGLFKNMKNGDYNYGILYIDGVYYETWNIMTLSSTESQLDQTAYNSYAQAGELPPVNTARITYVHGEADVGSDGFLRGFRANANISLTDIFGSEHELEVDIAAEIKEISGTVNSWYEKIMNAVAAHVPEKDRYYDISFTLDSDGNPIIENIYDGRNSNYVIEDGYGEIPEAYPDVEFESWLEQRIIEMAADPIYAGVDSDVLEAIARNEWIMLYGEAA